MRKNRLQRGQGVRAVDDARVRRRWRRRQAAAVVKGPLVEQVEAEKEEVAEQGAAEKEETQQVEAEKVLAVLTATRNAVLTTTLTAREAATRTHHLVCHHYLLRLL